MLNERHLVTECRPGPNRRCGSDSKCRQRRRSHQEAKLSSTNDWVDTGHCLRPASV